MKSGPQKYPDAHLSNWYQTRFGGDSMESNVIVWHSTEGRTLPDYGGGSNAPNITAVPDFSKKRIAWYQHFDFDTSARALVNKDGGVETNTMNVNQVEIVGTCDPKTHAKWKAAGYLHLYMADLPDWVVRDLAAYARWAHEEHGVRLSSGLVFKPYDSSYGANGVRMSGAKWNRFYGHCGHMHVPENDHGDPGAFPMQKILDLAAGVPTTPTTPTTPSGGTSMPEFVSLAYTTDRQMNQNWHQVYWDTEYHDVDGNHGAGGKTIMTGAANYQALVHLTLEDTVPGSTIQVRAVEEDTSGVRQKEWHITEAIATSGLTFVTIPFLNYLGAGRRLSFEIAYFSDDPASPNALMTRCEVQAHAWRS